LAATTVYPAPEARCPGRQDIDIVAIEKKGSQQNKAKVLLAIARTGN
jgi:hypothetical protein